MSIYEYNEEYVKKTLFEDGFDCGQAKTLLENIQSLMQNLNLDLETACKSLGITTTDYDKAKKVLEEAYY